MLRPLAAILVVFSILPAAPPAHSILVPCRTPVDAARIANALSHLRGTVDPCGESSEIAAVLDRLERCAAASYEICTSATVDRNVLHRTTITWNPDLRSELEPGCDGDAAAPVGRDPTASLLHELVHAADACDGRNPGDHELDAVRVENIYRRAAGLCQRTGYGTALLPAAMQRICTPGACPCSIPASADVGVPSVPAPTSGPHAADAAPPPAGSDAGPLADR
jgi:hypothetical protein